MTVRSPARITSRDLRKQNRLVVLRALLRLDVATRQELAARTKLSVATVSTIVNELLAARVVGVAGVASTGVGRPLSRLQIDPDGGRLIGVDVAETYVSATVYDLRVASLGSFGVPLDEHEKSPEYVVAGIARAVHGALGVARIPVASVVGVGVSLPGQVQPEAGVSVFAPNWSWHDVRIEQLLEDALALPVHVDNPLKAITAAELWFGEGRLDRSLVTVNLGTGVGAGIALQGAIVRGETNNAGEWGHTLLMLDGRACHCGRRGCVETYVGVPGVVDTLREIDPGHPALRLGSQSEFVDAVRAGLCAEEPAMVALLGRTAHFLAAALGDLINFTNPRQVRLTGWTVDRLGDWLIPAAKAELAEHVLPSSFAAVSVERTSIPGNLVGAGMATLTLENFLAVVGVGVPNRPLMVS
ncbi:ROK family protein [Pengzhenrongella sp.]|uniref:ROK family protein n=1 Tax=Pengzhenrongella sp. TaxID=2888820 RepID=UPI002F95588F